MTAIAIVMGTSALMMPVEFNARMSDGLDRLLTADADLVTPTAVFGELEELSLSGGAGSTVTSMGADSAAQCRTVEIEESYAGGAIAEFAEPGEADYIITNDKPPRGRVSGCGISVVGIRGYTTLTITGP